MKAVQFAHYGGIDVLDVVELDTPVPAAGEVLLAVKAAGTNPGEAAIRSGAMDAMFPATFPSGQGSDVAGVVTAVGDAVTVFAVGDEVLGWSNRRNTQAGYVAVPTDQLIARPAGMAWEVAGSLYVVAVTAYAAVRAVGAGKGDTVVVSGAAGGVGTVTVQLLRSRGATVIGLASQAHHDWLRSVGVTPVTYGDGAVDRIRAAATHGVDAFIDLFGPEYIDLALELGVAKDRIETIIAFQAAAEHGVKAEGSVDASTTEVLGVMAGLVASGAITLPVAATFPLDQVRAAYTELEKRHTNGKIVLIP